jgi:mannose-6-phosphate isomerase-like protein (cupin superfamily)
MDIYKVTELGARRKASAADYLELFRESSMSAGVYMLPKDAFDPQQPHAQDEMYYIVSGRGRFSCGGEDVEVGPGEAIFVARGVEHRFHDVTEDMTIVVVFAPPETQNDKDKQK